MCNDRVNSRFYMRGHGSTLFENLIFKPHWASVWLFVVYSMRQNNKKLFTLSYKLFFSGVRRFYDNLQMMYGWRINPYMMIGWCVTSPIFCMVNQIHLVSLQLRIRLSALYFIAIIQIHQVLSNC